MSHSKVNHIKPLSENKFLSLYDVTYTNKMNKEKHWMLASRKENSLLQDQYFNGKEEKIDAVVIVAWHKTFEKLVLIRQFRVPLNDYIYELPAGLVDPNEDRELTLKRELKEETGLDFVKISCKLGHSKLYLSPGMTDESVALTYCLCEGEVSGAYLEEDEDLEVVLVSQEEAKEILGSNHKLDIKVFLVLQSFATLGEKIFDLAE